MKNFDRRFRLAVCLGLTLMCVPRVFVAAQQAFKLRAIAPWVQMLPEAPRSNRPVFRVPLQVVPLQVVDGQGQAQPIPYDGAKLKDLLTVVTLDGAKRHPCQVFYAQPQGRGNDVAEERYILLLLDVSGSMFGSKKLFETAREAVRGMLQRFQPGDHIAVVPFESRDVKGRFERATFATQAAEALQQLNQINKPDNPLLANTALYSATGLALAKLHQAAGAKRKLLIVLTDGENDVRGKGDEKGLWGDEGLGEVQKLADSYRDIPIFTVWLGDGAGEQKLRQLAYPPEQAAQQHFRVQNTDGLRAVLSQARATLGNEFRITFRCGSLPDFTRLTTQHFEVSMPPLANQPVQPVQLKWTSRDPTRGQADQAELEVAEAKALEPLRKSGQNTGNDQEEPLGKKLLALLARTGLLAGTLLVLWFGAPRVFWPGASLPGAGLLPNRFKRQPPKAARRRAPGARPIAAPSATPAKARQRFEETQTFDHWRDRRE